MLPLKAKTPGPVPATYEVDGTASELVSVVGRHETTFDPVAVETPRTLVDVPGVKSYGAPL